MWHAAIVVRAWTLILQRVKIARNGLSRMPPPGDYLTHGVGAESRFVSALVATTTRQPQSFSLYAARQAGPSDKESIGTLSRNSKDFRKKILVLRIPMMADQYDMKLAQAEHHVSLMRQYANDEDCRPFMNCEHSWVQLGPSLNTF
jgi:hypothetical protein